MTTMTHHGGTYGDTLLPGTHGPASRDHAFPSHMWGLLCETHSIGQLWGCRPLGNPFSHTVKGGIHGCR